MPNQLKVAFAAAVLLVLFMSAKGTGALWHDEKSIDAGTITTGNLSLLLGNGSETKQNYEFVDLNGSNLVPGDFVQAPLTVSNGGTTNLSYNLVGATTAPATPTSADTALSAGTVLSVYAGMDRADCAARRTLTGSRLYVGPASSGITLGQPRPLATGGSAVSTEVLCLRVEVNPTTPQTAAGGRLHLTLDFTGQQR